MVTLIPAPLHPPTTALIRVKVNLSRVSGSPFSVSLARRQKTTTSQR